LQKTSDGTTVKAAPARDRIKWWNVVPGDQVRVMGDKKMPMREVLAVNKVSNRVFLQSDKKEGDRQPQPNPLRRQNPSKNVHYSGVQLFLGNYSYPKANGEKESLPVFARRLGTSEPRWENGKWIWDRFAVATTPRLPTWSQGVQEHIPIPWPEPPKPPQMEPTQYDTPEDVVAEVTYAPSPVPEHPSPSLAAGSLRKNCADDYVRMLRADIPYDQTAFPAELLLTRELSNPHSRTKKRIRYLTAQARQRDLLKHYIDEELKSLNGRTRREARAEATFRWRARIEDDRKAELKRRWVQRGQGARLQRKQERQTKKLEKEKKRLRDLVLTAAKNQVLPEVQA